MTEPEPLFHVAVTSNPASVRVLVGFELRHVRRVGRRWHVACGRCGETLVRDAFTKKDAISRARDSEHTCLASHSHSRGGEG